MNKKAESDTKEKIKETKANINIKNNVKDKKKVNKEFKANTSKITADNTKNKKDFEIVKGPTSDIEFLAYGKDYDELFVNAARGLFSIICDIDNVDGVNEEEFAIEENTIEELMISWLQELIASIDIENNFYSDFDINIVEDKGRFLLKGTACGESVSLDKTKTLVKAVTYHEFGIDKVGGRYRLRVVVDI